MDERRYQAGRPYHRPHGKYEANPTHDYLFSIAITLCVGGMLGAVITLGVMLP